ncbi:hypothetical protein DPMN_072264 [Dreissena polymorpha]|uniref:Uncharacterized protein n=1 Tax=Dreissena polymorpha TaxID=45954 RepID=A0A9D3Z487_DREPO|nr:hypothetical protein DPMN_072264 [Dreissena polymorpha]
MVRTKTSASAKTKKTRDARYRRNKRERIIGIGIQCDRRRRVKEATGIDKDEKMMEILPAYNTRKSGWQYTEIDR